MMCPRKVTPSDMAFAYLWVEFIGMEAVRHLAKDMNMGFLRLSKNKNVVNVIHNPINAHKVFSKALCMVVLSQ